MGGFPHLGIVDFPVADTGFKEFGVAACTGYAALFQYENMFGVLYGTYSLGYDDLGRIPEMPIQAAPQFRVGTVIQGA
jgi:hypothetical protein